MMINRLVELVTATRVTSLLDHPLPRWTMMAHQHGITDTGGRAMSQLRYGWWHLLDLAEDTDAETEFARDIWRGSVLGARPSPKLHEIRFDWLGFTVDGNGGHALGKGFATALHESLGSVLGNFGDEKVTQSSHLEKLALIRGGLGYPG